MSGRTVITIETLTSHQLENYGPHEYQARIRIEQVYANELRSVNTTAEQVKSLARHFFMSWEEDGDYFAPKLVELKEEKRGTWFVHVRRAYTD
jgi:hypothetical protein